MRTSFPLCNWPPEAAATDPAPRRKPGSGCPVQPSCGPPDQKATISAFRPAPRTLAEPSSVAGARTTTRRLHGLKSNPGRRRGPLEASTWPLTTAGLDRGLNPEETDLSWPAQILPLGEACWHIARADPFGRHRRRRRSFAAARSSMLRAERTFIHVRRVGRMRRLRTTAGAGSTVHRGGSALERPREHTLRRDKNQATRCSASLGPAGRASGEPLDERAFEGRLDCETSSRRDRRRLRARSGGSPQGRLR